MSRPTRRAPICGIVALIALLALASTAAAQAPAAASPTVKVTLATSLGPIVLELETAKAPITTANFLRYVDQKRYDGATFYRASKAPGETTYGLVQGGLQNDPKKVLKPIAHESTAKTGLSHVDGAISMGRFAPGTATSDFFLILGDQKYLDAGPEGPGFAAFGRVAEGMDVARKILVEPTSPTAGEGVMKGEMLARPVRILTARRATP